MKIDNLEIKILKKVIDIEKEIKRLSEQLDIGVKLFNEVSSLGRIKHDYNGEFLEVYIGYESESIDVISLNELLNKLEKGE